MATGDKGKPNPLQDSIPRATSQACLVELSLTGGLWDRILVWIMFSLVMVAMANFSYEPLS